MEEFLDFVNLLLDRLVNEFEGGSFIGPAKLIAGIGAFIGIYIVWKKSTTDAEKINVNEIWRIGILLIGIIFYGTFIKLVNLPLNLMSESIRASALTDTENTEDFFNSYNFNSDRGDFTENENQENELNELINEAELVVGSELNENENIEPTSGGGIASIFSGPSIGERIYLWTTEAIYNFIHFLGVVSIIILNVVRSFFLIVLTYFGVFVMAFSIYPGLQNSFFQWLQKYINVFLWLPISYILQGILAKLFSFFSADLSAFNTDAVDPVGFVNLANNAVIAIVGLCSLVAFATVPLMSSWLVSAATNSVGSKIKGKGVSGAQKAGKIAASAKTGGVSGVIKK